MTLPAFHSRFGASLSVIGIIDPDSARAEKQIAAKNAAGVAGYGSTVTWATPEEAGAAIGAGVVDLAIVGAPPHFRGTAAPPADLDLRLIKALPNTRFWLVEKPASAAQPGPIAGQETVATAWRESGAVVASGYMMNSLLGIKMIQKIIEENNLVVMGTAAR